MDWSLFSILAILNQSIYCYTLAHTKQSAFGVSIAVTVPRPGISVIYHIQEDNIMKRIITLQDISCVGRCSITVALPILSAMGVECGILPTAVLSTHTMFHTFTCKDLSDQIEPISDAWEKEQITFDGIYTGYLASGQQCEQICRFFDRFSTKENLILVDPAMADNGKLYAAFDDSFPAEMAKVCSKADIILPNITEASLLTGIPYQTEYGPDYIQLLLEKLLELGCQTAVLTGVSYQPGLLGVAYLDRTGKQFSYFTRRCAQSYHGTGDLYSSTVLGGLMRGLELGDALALAADFVVLCIEATSASKSARWYGVEFESQIPKLCEMLEEKLKNSTDR